MHLSAFRISRESIAKFEELGFNMSDYYKESKEAIKSKPNIEPINIKDYEEELKEKAKTECLVHLRNFWMKKSETVASN